MTKNKIASMVWTLFQQEKFLTLSQITEQKQQEVLSRKQAIEESHRHRKLVALRKWEFLKVKVSSSFSRALEKGGTDEQCKEQGDCHHVYKINSTPADSKAIESGLHDLERSQN